jgi:hypothetical protein
MTKVLVGPWLPSRNEALCDALGKGQAFVNPGRGNVITLHPFAAIERTGSRVSEDEGNSECRKAGSEYRKAGQLAPPGLSPVKCDPRGLRP